MELTLMRFLEPYEMFKRVQRLVMVPIIFHKSAGNIFILTNYGLQQWALIYSRSLKKVGERR